MAPRFELAVHLDGTKQFYTNGDDVRGKVVLSTLKSMNIDRIDVKLRCREVAEVSVINVATAISVSSNLIYRSYDRVSQNLELEIHTLFPAHPGMEGNHTIREGNHDFEFIFRIPDDVSLSSFSFGGETGIHWSVEAVMTIDNNGPQRHVSVRKLQVWTLAPSRPNSKLTSQKESIVFGAQLPGAPSGILRLLKKRQVAYIKDIPLSLTLWFPEEGLTQAPDTLGVNITITCDSPELVVWKQFRLYLIEQCVVRAEANTTTIKREHVLLEFDEEENDLSFFSSGETIDLSRDLQHKWISPWLAPTFRSHQLTHKFEIVAETIVASRYRHQTTATLRVEVPIKVWSPFTPPAA